MRVGKRRAVLNIADQFRNRTRSELERAFIIQRSTTAPEAIAALVDPDLDVHEISRVARRVLAGERRAIARFSDFANERINSLARVLCLSGDDRSLDQGLDILRAQARLLPQKTLPPLQRSLLADGLILRRRFEEAAAWLVDAEFEGLEQSRYALSVFNPFRSGSHAVMHISEWVALFNSFMSPSGGLAPIELAEDGNMLPFERLSAPCGRRVEGPLVTVVMSSFKPDESIFVSIRSILNQSWKSLELLVVDDASGPEYDEIYRRVVRMDTRIRVVRQKVNGGTYLVRNKALTLARGAFIGFQDDDDWSHPERIERQMAPLLRDSSIMATQSMCFRTDEYLDPVRIGYRQHLRRNESSLLFRTEVVRRIGFFHYTRKGGDSEYRFRLEAAFGQPVTVVGDEALAIIRLTPGSLSRDEFAAGFRHPSRLVYRECFSFVHARSSLEDSYYRSIHEYSDSFVPAKFQPRRKATDAEHIDVVIVADLRSCASTNSWVVNACSTLDGLGLRVGLAHYVGLRFGEFRNDRLTPEIAELFVDGIADPVDLGESREVTAVVVADAALLQHSAWQPTQWTVQRVFARRLITDCSLDMYDDATAGFTSLRQFGVRPTWVAPEADAGTLTTLVRSAQSAASPSPSDQDFDTFMSPAPAGRQPLPQRWRCTLTIPSAVERKQSLGEMVRVPEPVPYSVSRSRNDGRWCVVVGWPSFGFDCYAEPASASRVLLDAWSRGTDDFERQYADLGGSCIVIRGDGDDVAVRSTAVPVAVERGGALIRISCPASEGVGHVLCGSNTEEVVLPLEAADHFNPIATPIAHDGEPFDELQLMVRWELRKRTGTPITVLIDDDEESALVLGLLRESIENVDLVVRRATGRAAKFLRSRFVTFRIAESPSAVELPTRGAEGVRTLGAFSALTAVATSYRFRRLLEVVQKVHVSDVSLDGLWLGLGRIPRGRAHTEWSSPSAGGSATTPQMPILRSQTTEEPTRAVEPGGARTVRIAPDLARGEEHPLIARFFRGSTKRLVIVLSSRQNVEMSEFRSSQPDGAGASDHSLLLTDTTPADDSRLQYGWFFGSANDNLILRYAQLIRQMSSHLDCSEVIVRGHGRTAIPAVLLASFLRHATALISDPESIAGESDGEQFDKLVESHAHDALPTKFVESNAHRLRLRDVLETAPPELRLVITRSRLEEHTGYALVEADPRSVVVADTADDWLTASVEYPSVRIR